jgi:CheY-like chemotaxis protein
VIASGAVDGPTSSAPPVRDKRILLVEDDPLVAEALSRLLRLDEHRVDHAHDGLEALERVETNEYDIILSDVRMPRLDGRGFYTALGRCRPDLVRRTAFLTANAESHEILAFFAATGTRWLAKPASLADIRALLHRLVSD